MDDLTIERVLVAVEQIPEGRVAPYGDIAELVGIGPRQVGRVMRDWGGDVTWWRVTNRDGDLPGELLTRALPHWEREGIAVKANGCGCSMKRHRADLRELATSYHAVTESLR